MQGQNFTGQLTLKAKFLNILPPHTQRDPTRDSLRRKLNTEEPRERALHGQRVLGAQHLLSTSPTVLCDLTQSHRRLQWQWQGDKDPPSHGILNPFQATWGKMEKRACPLLTGNETGDG